MYTKEQKKQLRSELLEEIKASGLSNNKFAVERLGFSSGSKLSHVINGWDKPGLVGDETWQIIDKYLQRKQGFKLVATNNLMKVFNVCERASKFKRAMVVEGEGGFGKTTALIKYKEVQDAKENGIKVHYMDASLVKNRKQFIVALMEVINCYKHGTINNQLLTIREAVKKQNCLIVIDEVSSLAGSSVTILKDVITAIHDIAGLVLSGTLYFMDNIRKGASKNKHLFSETKDRLFMIPEKLEAPTDKEAKAIFEANGLHGEALAIAMGEIPELIKKSWRLKRTFRGISDAFTTIKIAISEEKSIYKPLSII